MACVVLLMVGCEKQKDSFNSFTLNMKNLEDASGAKTHWYNHVFWWDSGDNVVINGTVFDVVKDGSTWKATSSSGAEAIGDYFYLAYPYDEVGGEAEFNSSNFTYGPVSFDGTLPLAAKTKTNSMTLTPCCAVIIGADNVTFYNGDPNDGGESGVIDGEVLSTGYINAATATVQTGEGSVALDYEEGIDAVDGCIVIPMTSSSVTAWLGFNWDNRFTARAVVLEKGKIYVVELD